MAQRRNSDNRQPGLSNLNYRLALDIGSASIGWAMVRLDNEGVPCAVIRAGVRVFPDGRDPKDGSSLAVTRRAARAMRRRRDRFLKRQARMTRLLIELGFFPASLDARKALVTLNPYELRARGLDEALTPPEFARALFHINQRRGFRSNRKTDKADTTKSELKQAISRVRAELQGATTSGGPRTVGELLWRRQQQGLTVRARYREQLLLRADGRSKIDRSYDLYIDRAMIAEEFDQLWASQASRNPALFSPEARLRLRDCLLFQRELRPVLPGRCTLLPDEPRAPLAMPSTQLFRILQEVNNLRIVEDGFSEVALSIEQRDHIVDALQRHPKRSFDQLRRLLGLPGTAKFNLEDSKRSELKGNVTNAILTGKSGGFGPEWHALSLQRQDEIVSRLLNEPEASRLVEWLETEVCVDSESAQRLVDLSLVDGYGALSLAAIKRVLPHLQEGVSSFADAARKAGFHHSQLSENTEVQGRTFPVERVDMSTGEVKTWHVYGHLPYYGEVLQRHVGFGTGVPTDVPEKRYGRIANPTVHIGLNQVRTVVNALIDRYGHPHEVVVEVARDLKQGQEERREEQARQAANQKRNDRLRSAAASMLGIAPERVKTDDLQRLVLWEELNPEDPLDRRCPYSGALISPAMALSSEVEVDHILPFSRTLDDSLNNKVLVTRAANRVKRNRTPWEARTDFEAHGWSLEDVLARVSVMPRAKRYRFAEDGYQRWLKDDKDFLARALNDTRYLSRVAREYVRLICPYGTRVIPGRMTAMLRGKFGLNDVLGVSGAKNRDDHRHHAVDACVIAVTDQGLLQRFARASQQARERDLDRLVESMPLPWPSYREHVERAVSAIWVSHKPDHSHEGQMLNDTAYGILPDGRVQHRERVEGIRMLKTENLSVIPITEPGQSTRHGTLPDGSPKPYKAYKGDSNYCLDIVTDGRGKWIGEVVTTFAAYEAVRRHGSVEVLRADVSLSGRPLVMRLMKGDLLRIDEDGSALVLAVRGMNQDGRLTLSEPHEANVDARNRSKESGFRYTYKSAGSLQNSSARKATVSPIGELRVHPGR